MERRDTINRRLTQTAALAAAIAALAIASKSGSELMEGSRELYHGTQTVLDDSGQTPVNARFTYDELTDMPSRPETAHKGDGFDDLVLRANEDQSTHIYETGVVPMERELLRAQLERRTGRTALWPGDTLRVHVIDDNHK